VLIESPEQEGKGSREVSTGGAAPQWSGVKERCPAWCQDHWAGNQGQGPQGLQGCKGGWDSWWQLFEI